MLTEALHQAALADTDLTVRIKLLFLERDSRPPARARRAKGGRRRMAAYRS
jgi:hypothetical protein